MIPTTDPYLTECTTAFRYDDDNQAPVFVAAVSAELPVEQQRQEAAHAISDRWAEYVDVEQDPMEQVAVLGFDLSVDADELFDVTNAFANDPQWNGFRLYSEEQITTSF